MNKIFLFDKSPEISETKDGAFNIHEKGLMQYLSNMPKFEKVMSSATYDSEQQNGFLEALAETLQELQQIKAKKDLIKADAKAQTKLEKRLAKMGPLASNQVLP